MDDDVSGRWGSNEIIFNKSVWSSFEPMMRADFALFDQYCPSSSSSSSPSSVEPSEMISTPDTSGTQLTETTTAKIAVPITAYWATADKKVTQSHVQQWGELTTAKFECKQLKGNHLFVYDGLDKAAWFNDIIATVTSIL